MAITFEITDEYNIKIIENSNGVLKNNKFIEVDDLIDILKVSKNIKKIEKKELDNPILFRSPIYPCFNDISVINYVISNKNEEFLFFKKNKSKYDFNYHGTIYRNVNLPSFVFGFKIYESIIQEGYIAAIKDEIITENTQLYVYPFGNVYGFCNICFGTNHMKDHLVNSLVNIHSMPERFFLMETTSSAQSSKYKMQPSELLEHLQENEFDIEMLFEAKDFNKNNIKYINFVEYISGKII